ncbi:MAG: BTAD domain-containing putative transcriptional regulator [Thermoanaerobaculia bacterium]
MSLFELRLLGDFDVRVANQAIYEFESQKVRGLLAFLMTNRGHSVSRDRLATLLWASKSETAARRNLRQALHNLRSALSAAVDPDEVLIVSHHDIQVNPDLDCWLDVERFEEATRRGLSDPGPDPYHLSIAASLYTGDFLSGFFIKDSPPFEDWMLSEQERLREAAVDSFRTLIESYLRRGEYRFGIQFARRLLAIDPLSEEAHRSLMRLYALSGRRSRALRQYEILRNLLSSELKVEPLPDTRELHQSILDQTLTPATGMDREGPVGPMIPLVGREEAHAGLEEIWQDILAGRGRLTMIEGETGVGRTRLARSVVDAITGKQEAVVLQARAFSATPLISYGLFRQLLGSALDDFLPEESVKLLCQLSAETLADLAAMAPERLELAADGLKAPAEVPASLAARLADSWIELLEALSSWSSDFRRVAPVILLIDDAHSADPESQRLLTDLVSRISDRPVWALVTINPKVVAAGSPLSELLSSGAEAKDSVDRFPLDRLDAGHLQQIASSLVGRAGFEELADFLSRQSAGLPLTATEMVNLLWDDGTLMPRGAGRWVLRGKLDPRRHSLNLHQLIQLRIRRLPTSARRLLAVAATIGQRFDVELLQKAAGEHMAVVDTCLQLMLERWLVRQSPSTWSPSRRERDILLWAQGIRRGWFEFSHAGIRSAILSDIRPRRRGSLHREVADALRETRGQDVDGFHEALAYHELAAGRPESALDALETALRHAETIGADETASWYRQRLEEIRQQLSAQGGSSSGSPVESRSDSDVEV